MNSCAIKVHEALNVQKQVHVIVGKDRICDNLVINNQARKCIQIFQHENPFVEIHFNDQIQDESVPEFVVLRVHSGQEIPLEANIRDITMDDEIPTIHLILGNSEIDDTLYINACAKDELRRIFGSISIGNVAGVDVKKGTLESESSQLRKRVYIKCIANLPKKAFSNFIGRYIPKIEPIWMNEETPIEEGYLCITVCFNLSRLLDDIDAVVQVTPRDSTNMLVVIQNCPEGIIPGSMLKSNPSDKFIDFTTILYGDGECYDCHVNCLAGKKVQAFIDNN